MFDSQILDVFIGLIFIFLLVSIVCTAVREGIEGWLKTRAAYLEYGIRCLLQDLHGSGLAKSLYEHPLIFGLYAGAYHASTDAPSSGVEPARPGMLARGNDLPSYVPASNFAMALLDLAANGPIGGEGADGLQPLSLDRVRANIRQLGNPVVERVVLSALDTARGDLDKALHNIEVWYDSSMDRISGWYRRSTQKIILAISLVVTVGLNINAITIADYLYTNDTARGVVLSQAEQAADDAEFARKSYAEIKYQLAGLGLPIGWSEGWGAPRRGPELQANGEFLYWNYVFAPILGWLFTALAATLGAPFWFDVLNRVMVIRSTVKPREKSPEEGSQDRSPSLQPVPSAGAVAPAIEGRFIAGTAHGAGDPQPFSIVRDAEDGIDSCCGAGIAAGDTTPDDRLPAAQGGVA